MLRSTASAAAASMLRRSSTKLMMPATMVSAMSLSRRLLSSSTTASVVQPPSNLRSVKRELVRVLDEDSADLSAAPDTGLLDYIKENQYVVKTADDGRVVVTRHIGDYEVVLSFEADADEDQPQDENENGEENPEQPENLEEEEEKMSQHSFEVQIKNVPADKSIRVVAYADRDGVLCIEYVALGELAKGDEAGKVDESAMNPFEADSQTSLLYFDDMSDAGQDKLIEFLETIGIDDRFAQFVQHYAQVVRTQRFLDKMKLFKAFLQA